MMKTLNGKRIALSAILLCVLYLGYRIHESRSDAALLREQTLERAIPTVAVVSPKPVPATETITLPGNIVGWYEAPIYARVTGYVKMWYKDYGGQVKKGDVLAEINAPDLDAQYAQARADLETERARYKLAEVTAKRWIALRPNHAVSEQSITVQEQNMRAQAAMVNAAEQKVKNIEAFIGFKTIVAPFDGVVTQRNINVGDLVSKEGNLSTPSAITNLFTVAVVDMLRLFVNVPASFGPFLQPGLTADVTVPQLPNRHFTGKFLTVARGFDVSTRTAVTVFTIAGAHAGLLRRRRAVVTEDDRVHLKTITVSKLMDTAVEVAEGISTSDRVVNNPSAALLEADKVRVVTPAAGYDLVNTESPESKEQAKNEQSPNG